jgi:hypothetical protein
MVGLVGVAPYQPDGRQTENILLMLAGLNRRSFGGWGYQNTALHSPLLNM